MTMGKIHFAPEEHFCFQKRTTSTFPRQELNTQDANEGKGQTNIHLDQARTSSETLGITTIKKKISFIE